MTAFNQKKIQNILLDHIVEILLVILIVALWITKDSFMTAGNWATILRSSSMKGIIAFGMTMVIIAGQIDLSIGSTVALSGVIVACACRDLPGSIGVSVDAACVIGILIAFASAFVFGLIHAFAQHKFKMLSFIVTLATQYLIYGLAGVLCDGFPIANQYPAWFQQLGIGRIGGANGLPIPAVIMLIMFVFLFFIMRYSTTGRAIYAVGGNEESARLSGINVLATKTFAFVAVQLMAVLACLMNSAQVLSGSFSFGKGWETDVISAVVIGGTSMLGGIGKPSGTLIGMLFLGVILNGMTILDVSIYIQYIIKGMLMFGAVLIATYQSRKKQ